MRPLLLLSPLAALLPLQAGCLDQGFSILNQEPWVQIEAPTNGDTLFLGPVAPVLEATVDDDKTDTLALALVWTLGDGTTITGENAVSGTDVRFTVRGSLALGDQSLTLSATDEKGEVGTDTILLTVVQNTAPTVSFLSPTDGELVRLGEDVAVRATFTDPDEDSLDDLGLLWDDLSIVSGAIDHPDEGGEATFTVSAPDLGEHSLSVTVTDGAGETVEGAVSFTVRDPDADGDGFIAAIFGGDDCDDEDAGIHPDALETCDGVDEDCDTSIDEDAGDRTLWYADGDGDRWGDDDAAVLACAEPKGHVDRLGDCDDGVAAVNPDATEICDGIDNDCSGQIDGADATDASTWYVDADADGYGDAYTPVTECSQPTGTVVDDTDCDDGIFQVNPGHAEICDGLDNDCNGLTDEPGAVDAPTWYSDTDTDGYGNPATGTESCSAPSGTVADDTDCDDAAAAVNPGATELCNGVDDNCDGTVDEDTADDADTWYADADGDSYGDAGASTDACSQPSGYVADDQDCLDTDATVSPAGTEVCNGLDDNCDGTVDEDTATDASTWYADVDGDTYGDPDVSRQACTAPPKTVADATDCDDRDAAVNPAATELCNGIDDNCDGTIDEDTAADASTWYADTDSDGFGDPASASLACSAPSGTVANPADCDDTETAINPLATEWCDTVDNDCDSAVDEAGAADAAIWYADTDTDGYGDASSTQVACTAPSGFGSDATDCDDGNILINPAATEVCDTADNDCDGRVDEAGAADAGTYYPDADGDGFGDPDGTTTVSCEPGSGWTTDLTDCDDGASTTFPGADEICDDVDSDCDLVVDEDPLDGSWWPEDLDGDTMGDPVNVVWACTGTDDDWDCDDTDPTEPQVVAQATGTAAGPGTWDDPWDTIQAAIDQSSTCVLVLDGTYNEAIDFGGRNLLVGTAYGASVTTIDATGFTAPAVTLATGETAATLQGFTITGGVGVFETTSNSYACSSASTCTDYYDTWWGGGVYVDGASVVFEDLVIRDNTMAPAATVLSGDDTYYTYSFGGGVAVLNGSVTATGSSLEDNYGDQGGGLYVDAASTVDWTTARVVGNGAHDGAGVQVDGGSLALTNMVVAGNDAAAGCGGGLHALGGSLTTTNVTVGLNLGATGDGLCLADSASSVLSSSIVYGDAGEGINNDGSASHAQTYSTVFGFTTSFVGLSDPTGLDGNLASDPLFTAASSDGDWTNDDWTLGAGSPAIDAGDPDSSLNDTDGTVNDQGAFGGPNGAW